MTVIRNAVKDLSLAHIARDVSASLDMTMGEEE